VNVNVDAGVGGITTRTPYGTRANVECGHAGRPQCGRGDRDDTATRTQIQYPPPVDQLGPFQCVYQQTGVVLRRVNTIDV
jgi:hypothetical protein